MKKKTIYILVVLSVLLLFANVVLNIVNKPEPQIAKAETDAAEIDSLFVHAIYKFNLDSSWITQVPINSSQYDSLRNVYRIKLPGDLRPATILLELKNAFQNYPVDLISDEKVVNATTTLNILSNDKLKLQSAISVETELERPHTKLSFIITNYEELNQSRKESLFYSMIPYSILLVPSIETDSTIIKLNDYKKSYSLFIDDDIDEDKYKLASDFSKTRLKEAVRYLSRNYSMADLFIVNDKSSIFNSAIFNFIRDEFTSREVKLYRLNDFISLPDNYDEALSLLKFYLESGVGEKGKIIVTNANIFYESNEILLEAKKRGTKFYRPNEIIQINQSMSNSN